MIKSQIELAMESISEMTWWTAGLVPPIQTTSELGFIEMFYSQQSDAQKIRDCSIDGGCSDESISAPTRISKPFEFAKNRGARNAGFVHDGALMYLPC